MYLKFGIITKTSLSFSLITITKLNTFKFLLIKLSKTLKGLVHNSDMTSYYSYNFQ